MNPEHRENVYMISTANVLDKATLHLALSMDLAAHVQTAQQAGYHGVEAWPSHPVLTTQLTFGSLDEPTRKGILSTHQSPRTEKRSDVPKNPYALQPLLILPEQIKSLDHLNKIHNLVGDVPAVLYAPTPQSFHETTDISQRRIQLSPETCKAWGVNSIETFVEAMQKNNFTGVCLDTTHLERSKLGSWQQSMGTLLKRGVIDEVHIAVGRVDLRDIDRNHTIRQLKDLTRGTHETDILSMLRFLNDYGWRGDIAIELLPSALKEITNPMSRFVRTQTLTTCYEQIRHTLHSIFEHPNGS